MGISILAVREVLDGVETTLKEALHEAQAGFSSSRTSDSSYIEKALRCVEDANIELIKVR